MVLLTLSDFNGNTFPAVYAPLPEPAEGLLAAEAAYVIVDWEDPALLPELMRLAEAKKLVVPERWQAALPQAGLQISSSISGGDFTQRLQQLPESRCWLRLEAMNMAFPLPCPDGQGTPLLDLPKTEGFYSSSLCCRYVHSPEQVILFDTAETLERKLLLAQDSGFRGFFQIPGP